MNPLTNVKNITKLNEREQALGFKVSWHDQYKDSAWLFLGGLPYDLTEGDVLCVFSQFGEIVNVNLIRDKKTGKSKGFCFLCYENQQSTVLAVDNFNGVKVLGRTIRVDHCANYKAPKERDDDDEITKALHAEGCAPKIPIEEENLAKMKKEPLESEEKKKHKGEKRKKRKKKKKSKKETPSSSSSSSDSSDEEPVKVKKEKFDVGYEKYNHQQQIENQQNETRSYRSLERNKQKTHREESPRDNFGGKNGDRFVARDKPNERISTRDRSVERGNNATNRSRSAEKRNTSRGRSRSNERQINPQHRSILNDRHREKSRSFERSNNHRKNRSRSIERRRNPREHSRSTERKSSHGRSRSFETKQPINRYDTKGKR